MIRQSPPELQAQRPVRSDFARRSAGSGGLNIKKFAVLGGLVALAVIGGYLASTMGSTEETKPEEIPTVTAETPIKERPEQPGGIDIPHQDVAVFEKLDAAGQTAGQGKVEHLLPEPEKPMDPSQMQAHPEVPVPSAAQQESAKISPQPTEPVAADPLPPAITEVEPEPAKTEAAKPEPVKAEPVKKEVAKKEAAQSAKTVVEKVQAAPVKKVEKATKIDPVEAQKAEAAMARLPKELFTSNNFVPSSTAQTQQVESVKEASAPVSEPQPVAASSGKEKSVQLSSSQDEALAEKEMKRLQAKYAGVLGGASLRVVRADLGAKGIYYRVISAPLDEAKAKTVCSDILKMKGSCIVQK